MFTAFMFVLRGLDAPEAEARAVRARVRVDAEVKARCEEEERSRLEMRKQDWQRGRKWQMEERESYYEEKRYRMISGGAGDEWGDYVNF